MAMLRRLLGEALRRERLAQHRTLREVSSAARVSLGYLSEVERGQKEASSELLASICEALEVRLSNVLREVSEDLAVAETGELTAVPGGAAELAPAELAPAELAPAGLAAAGAVGRGARAEVNPFRGPRVARPEVARREVVNRVARPAA
jgi:transcriptional regulator with XRE-family HTH domain